MGVFLAGCPAEVMTDRRYIPAPSDNVPLVDNEAGNQLPVEQSAPSADNKVAPPTVADYEPMTDVTPSGGVDSVSGKSAVGKSAAKSPAAAPAGTYEVKRGDTLGRIARRHGVRVSDLMQANKMDEAAARKLRIGQKLVIPARKSGAAKKASASRGKKAVGATGSAAVEDGKYTVKAGDTPERIARRFKIKVSDLLKANNLDENSARRLQVNQKLIIPGKSGASAKTPAPAPAAKSVPAEQSAAPAQPAESAPVTVTAPAPTVESFDTNGSENHVAIEAPEDTTLQEYAVKNGIDLNTLVKLNPNNPPTAKIEKGGLIFVPKK